MKIKLILTQDTDGSIITVPAGEVPVIRICTNYKEYVVAAVNFLRCGCPSVQLLVTYTRTLDDDYLNELKEISALLQLPKERFIIEEKFPIIVMRREFEN
jgi:hypothetical protein